MAALPQSDLLALLVAEIEATGLFDKVNRQKNVDLPERQQSSASVFLVNSVVSQNFLGQPFDCGTPIRVVLKARATGVNAHPDEILDAMLRKVCGIFLYSNELAAANFSMKRTKFFINWHPQDIFDIDESVSIAEVVAEFNHRVESSVFVGAS